MIKKCLNLLIIAILFFSTYNSIFTQNVSAEADVKIKYNGEYIYSDVYPIIVEGRVLVPVRAIFETATDITGGGDIVWNAEAQEVKLNMPGTEITIKIGSALITRFDYRGDWDESLIGQPDEFGWKSEYYTDVPAQIVNGRTLVPLRALSELLGCDVDWQDDIRTVIITSENSVVEEEIVFKDKGFEFCVRYAIANTDPFAPVKNIYDGILTEELLSKVTKVNSGTGTFEHPDILSLEDIKYLPNLDTLIIENEKVTDLEPISKIKEWKYLDLWGVSAQDDSVLEQINVTDTIIFTDDFGFAFYIENNNYKEGLKKYREINKKLDKIIDELILEDMTDFGKYKVLHDWLIRNITYDEDYVNSYDTLKLNSNGHHLLMGLIENKGICYTYSRLYEILCKKANLQCIIVTGEANNDNHSWNIVNIDNQYYHVDVTWDDPNDILDYDYFLISDSTIRKNHSWTMETPICSTDYIKH